MKFVLFIEISRNSVLEFIILAEKKNVQTNNYITTYIFMTEDYSLSLISHTTSYLTHLFI